MTLHVYKGFFGATPDNTGGCLRCDFYDACHCPQRNGAVGTGRRPQYNGNKGKDHWLVTSVMFMGPGITGKSIIGASDKNFNALKVNPQTLKLDDSGVYIQPEQLQMELRRLAGLGNSPLNQKYPLIGPHLTLLG